MSRGEASARSEGTSSGASRCGVSRASIAAATGGGKAAGSGPLDARLARVLAQLVERPVTDRADRATLAARHLEHWRRTLAGVPEVLALPTDRPRPAQQSFHGDTVHFTVPAEVHRRLQDLAASLASVLRQ